MLKPTQMCYIAVLITVRISVQKFLKKWWSIGGEI